MSDKNPDLEALHEQLITLVGDLAHEQESATTVEAVKAISREIAEVTHRVTLVGQLVFKARTDKLATATQAVTAGKASLDAAIARIDKVNAFITAVSRFLGLVDKAIDTAKLI